MATHAHSRNSFCWKPTDGQHILTESSNIFRLTQIFKQTQQYTFRIWHDKFRFTFNFQLGNQFNVYINERTAYNAKCCTSEHDGQIVCVCPTHNGQTTNREEIKTNEANI